jgi:TonB-dependent starch-binding outer membrane protein SusC
MRNFIQSSWRRSLLIAFAGLTFFRLSAQNPKEIHGTVFDNNTQSPLQGVTVLIKGTNNAVATKINGNFNLQARKGEILVLSFVGYEKQEITVNDENTLNVFLEEASSKLNQVVIVGYGRVKKSDLTGSVGSVSAKDLNAYPVTDAVIGLQGKASGVQVIQNSGAPGATISVRIRGGNSLLGNNEPLYVVDGFALSGTPEAINPNDIESIEVLKDASSTAIYGSRGANGVILISTKKGKTGKSQTTFDTYYSIQKVSKILDLLNAKEFAELANERAQNDGLQPYFNPDQVNSFQQGTDWQKLVFQSAPLMNYSINTSGGNENNQYSISASYLGQHGIIIGSGINSESLRANINQKLSGKIGLTYNATLTNTDLSQLNSDNGLRGNSVLSGALVAPPTIDPFDKNGNYSNVIPYSFSPNLLINPLAMALERKQKTNRKYILAGTAITYEPIRNLLFKTSLGIETSLTKNETYSPSIINTTPTGQATVFAADGINILNENTVTYSRKVNDFHNFTVLGGVTYQQNVARNFTTGNITGFSTDLLGTNNLQSGSVPGTPASSSSKWILFSYLGRFNYSFKNRYLFTGSMRADGSSRFGQGNKWGYFPSAAVAWRVINEEFVRKINLLSDLKLRLSWGKTGSSAINPFQTLNTLKAYQTVFNDQIYIGYAPSLTALANPHLKWETTTQSDAGLDMAIFQNRLSFTFDYYIKNTKDLLANVPLQISSGYTTTVSNIGRIQNSGIELGMNTILVDKAFKWNLNVNFSKNRNKVIELARASDVFGELLPLPLGAAVNLVRIGQPVGVFYGYVEDGLDEKGAIKYKDVDGVPGITSADRTIIGNPNPDFIYNIGSGFSYKNFELNANVQASKGGDIFNTNLTALGSSFYFGENQLKEVYYNHWSAIHPDPLAKYPKISSTTKFLPSDRYVEDGSFVRLRNLQLAYNFPVPKTKFSTMKSLQLYASAQNLFLITKYSGYDPQVNTRGGSNSISLGIDNTAYPNTKSYTVGLHLGL